MNKRVISKEVNNMNKAKWYVTTQNILYYIVGSVIYKEDYMFTAIVKF